MKEYTNKENYMNERPRTFNQFYAFETEKRKINSGTLKIKVFRTFLYNLYYY